MAPLAYRAPFLLAALGLLLGMLATQARAQPSLTRIEPGALPPGKTTEVTLHGGKLDEPLRIWSSFPATWEVVPGDPNQKGRASVKVKATLDPSAQCGIGGIAVAAAEGPSQVLLVPIDDLPSVADPNTNHDLATAHEIALPVAVDGENDGTSFDYYKFNGKGGQAISIEVLGARLGSDFDPVLRLLDAGGRQLALVDDDPALGADCRLRYTLPADGVYVIELRDNRYKDDGRYRLRIGNFPLVSTMFPCSATAGQPASLTAVGPAVEGAEPVSFQAATVGQPLVGSRFPGGDAAGLASVVVGDLPTSIEAIPADKPDEPTAVALPCTLNGRLEVPKDRDEFRFAATKGMRVRFKPLTRTLGSPALIQLRVLGPDGNQLAESAVNEDDEPAISFVAPADGEYRLAVQELVGLGGGDYTYRVEARIGPTFSLSLKNVNNQPARLSYTAAAGSAIELNVDCQRDGYDGPIALLVDSPRPGWQVFHGQIPANAKEGRLILVAPTDLQPGEFVPLRIVGKADVGGREHVAAMATTAQLRASRPTLPYPPLWLDGLISVGGFAAQPPFYNVAASKPEIFFPRLVGQTQLTLTFNRTVEAFKDKPLTVMPLQLPPGIAVAEVKRNGNGPQETYDIILRGAKDLPDGKHVFKYLTYAEHAGLGQAIVSAEVPVTVATPLSVSLVPAGPLTQGQTQKAKLVLARAGDDKQAVEVKFKKLPAGVTGPASIKLESAQNELEIDLTTAADAPVGKFDDIAVTATTKYTGVDLSVDSPNVSLEVKAP